MASTTIALTDSNDDDYGSVSTFYEDKVVLITGGTGFVGKVLTEKLLRSTAVKTIYLIFRGKNDKRPEERLQTILEEPIYCGYPDKGLDLFSKLKVVAGDLNLPQLGLRSEDRNQLVREVNIIFHAAADLNFDAGLKSAVNTNVGGTKKLLELARDMKNLEACMLVSTAYCYHPQIETEEIIYPTSFKYKDLLSICETSDESDKSLKSKIIGDSVTTYAFTKKMAEQVALDFADLPVAIFRPSIVLSTADEPLPGWTDNRYGPNSLILGIMTGFCHSLPARRSAIADMVPVDKAVNCLISAAWNARNRYHEDRKQIPVYNYVSINDAPMNWGTFVNKCLHNIRKNPRVNVFWYIFVFITHYSLIHKLNTIMFHYVPGLLYDVMACLKCKKLSFRLCRRYYVIIGVFLGIFCSWIISGTVFLVK